MQRIIEGVELKQLKKNVDERGYLCELLRKDWSIYKEFAMTYFSITFPGVVRGCHGFKALGVKPVLLVNFPTALYDYEKPDEERLPPDTDRIPYDWKLVPWLKHG